MISDFFLGLLVGVVLGLVTGILLADAYELAKAAMKDLKEDRGTPLSRASMFWVIVAFSLAQIAVGVFIIFDNYQENQFESCVFRYDQQFAKSYGAIAEANKVASTERFDWEEIVPKFFDNGGTKKDRREFQSQYNEYVRAYKELVEERKDSPYPALPAEFCGAPR